MPESRPQPVYVKAVARIAPPSHPEPDYSRYFAPLEARRLSSACKGAVAVATEVLKKTGIACPDAILTGTGLGCIDFTLRFLHAMTEGEAMKPTHFMMSTHNTLSSLVAQKLGCHGYNATYSHGRLSFESALLDAFLLLQEGSVRHALVLACEESCPDLPRLYAGTDIFDGAPGGMTAAFLLDTRPEQALCRLEDVCLDRTGTAAGSGDAVPVYSPAQGTYSDSFCRSALWMADAVESIRASETLCILNENATIRLCGK